MNDAIEILGENEEVAENTPVFIKEDGMEAVANNLVVAQSLSAHLDSGLTTQAEIKRTSIQLRNTLLHMSRSLHKEYTAVIDRREDLLANVEDVQAMSRKEALLKKQAEIEAQLAELG